MRVERDGRALLAQGPAQNEARAVLAHARTDHVKPEVFCKVTSSRGPERRKLNKETRPAVRAEEVGRIVFHRSVASVRSHSLR